MSLIHENAKESFKKTSLVKGDRVPGGGTITQVIRELGGNAYYVQWDELSFEEGPYALEELKSGSVAKRARKTATKKTAAFTYQGTEYFVGMAQQDGTCEVGGEQIDEGQEVFISEYIEGETQQMVCRWHGKDVQQGVVSKVAKTVRLIDTAGHTWLGEYPGEGELCPECGLPAVANDEHAYGPFGDPSNYDPDVFPDWKGATKKTAGTPRDIEPGDKWQVGDAVKVFEPMAGELEGTISRGGWFENSFSSGPQKAWYVDVYGQEMGPYREAELLPPSDSWTAKKNPVGKKVTIQSGPDAGLTGLVSRKGEGGWFVEVEGMETGPYKVASLKLDKTATKKTAEFFEGEEVFIEVDGEMIKGVVLSDDGGSQVEVGDPEDDPYMVGAPVMIDRDRLYRDRSGRGIDWSTSKKVANNASNVRDALDAFFLMDLAYDEDDLDRYALNAGNLADALQRLSQGGFLLADRALALSFDTNVSEEVLSELDSVLAEMAESVGLPKFTKKQAASYKGTICRICSVGKLKVTQVPYGYTCDYCWSTFDWEGNYTGRVGS